MITPILDRLPIVVERCHFEPDGSFPHYEPNPLLAESREFIVDRVRDRSRPRHRLRRRRGSLLLHR